MDLTVRDEQGEVIDPDAIGAVQLFRDHRNTVQRNAEKQESENKCV